MGIADLFPDVGADIEAGRAYEALIDNTAADANDEVYVTIDEFDPNQRWGPCPYTPRGTTYPTAGERALVVFSNTLVPWIVVWGPNG